MFMKVRRPLALVLAGSLCAFSLCLLLPTSPALLLIPAAILILLASFLIAKPFPRLSLLVLLLVGLLFGFLWRTGYDRLFMKPAVSLVGCREAVTATVIEKRSYGFVIRAEANGHHFKAFCRYYNDGQILPGDKLTFVTTFSLPTNSGGFDGERFYSSQGIPVTCLLSEDDEVMIEQNAAPLYRFYDDLRHDAQNFISRLFGKYDGEMAALLLGEKSALPEATRKNLSVTGLSHTFVVSGMHLSFIVSMLSLLRGRKGYLWVVLPASLLFAVFSGMGFSVVRAFLMLVYAEIANVLSLPRDPVTELVLSLFLILLYNPYALLNAGLIFSYLAVMGVFFLAPPLRDFLSPLYRSAKGLLRRVLFSFVSAFSVSLTAGLATLPAVAFYMRHFSAVFLLTNLLLLWLVEAIFMLGMVALFAGLLWVPLGKLIAIPVTWLLSLFLRVDGYFASLSFADIGVESPVVCAAIAFAVGLLFVLAFRRKALFRPLPLALLILPLLSALLFTEIEASGRSFTLTVLPSKEECALLSSHGVHFLIGYDEDVEELLIRKNIDYIDYLVLPKKGEADSFVLSFPVGEVLQNEYASFEIDDTLVTVYSEGNLRVTSEDATLSILLVPGQIRESDAFLLSREALKYPDTAAWLRGEPVYTFGTPPKNPSDDINVLVSAYTAGEFSFIAAGDHLKIR